MTPSQLELLDELYPIEPDARDWPEDVVPLEEVQVASPPEAWASPFPISELPVWPDECPEDQDPLDYL